MFGGVCSFNAGGDVLNGDFDAVRKGLDVYPTSGNSNEPEARMEFRGGQEGQEEGLYRVLRENGLNPAIF